MNLKFRTTFVLAALLAIPAAQAASPYRVPVHFSFTNNAEVGHSYFVVGSHPDVGAWDVCRAIPLAWHAGDVWSADIGVQAGTRMEYKFVRRETSAGQIANPENRDWWWPQGDNLVLDIPAEPQSPAGGKRVVFLCDWPEPVQLWYSMLDSQDFESTNEWQRAEMTKTGDARFEIDGVGEAGEWMRFTFCHPLEGEDDPGKWWWYHFRPTDNEETDFWSPLDAFCVRDAQVFNYEPEVPLSTPVSASRIEKVYVNSQADGVDSREIRIYLPRGYDQNLSRRYPVMYFSDGQNIFASDHSSAVAWGVDTAADAEIRAGHMRETILVGVPCRETPPPGVSSQDYAWAGRLWEYLPGDDILRGSMGNVEFAIPGNGYNYMKFLLDNVRPTLDWNYRTLTDRANTGHAGSSAGGLLSFWMGTYTNVFGLIGAVSGVYNEDYIPNFRDWCSTNLAAVAAPKRIWLDTGNGETNILGKNLYDSNWDALTLLLYAGHVQNKSLHFGVYHNTWDGGNSDHLGDHHEIAWAARTPDILKFLLPVTDDTNPLILRPPEIGLDGLTLQIPAYPGFTYTAKRVGNVMDLRKDASADTVCSTNIVDRPWGVITCPATDAGFYWVEAQ